MGQITRDVSASVAQQHSRQLSARFISKTSCIANGARQWARTQLWAIWGFGLLLGYSATFLAKSDVIFLLVDPISFTFRDSMRVRQTDDRRVVQQASLKAARGRCRSARHLSLFSLFFLYSVACVNLN